MRILHIGKYYPPYSGGIENLTQLLAEAGDMGDYQASVVAHSYDGADTGAGQWRGVEVRRSRSFGECIHAPIAPFFPIDLLRAIGAVRPQILHIHLPNLSAFWLFLCPSAWGKRWLLHWHADVEFRPEQRLARAIYHCVYRPLEWLLLKQADAVIVTSPNYLASSKALASFQAKCTVVPLATAPDAGEVTQEAPDSGTGWSNQPGSLKVLMVGRLTPYKGHRVLLQALAAARSETKLEAVLVGEGELSEDISRQVGELQLEPIVQRAGHVSNAVLDSLLHSCDVLCLPSLDRAEAFGLVLLEAMARGKPVIVSALEESGVGWVVEHELNGWKFPVGDEAALADRLRWCFNHSNELQLAGERGRQRYQQLFTPETVVEQTAAIYRKLLDYY